MPTSQYYIAETFNIFDASIAISPRIIPPILFRVNSRDFFSPKKLLKLTFQNSIK